MNGLIKKAGLGVALAATALAAAAPADAQRYGYRGYHGGWHHHGGGRTSAALLGGIVGLGVGAAIASNSNRGYYRGGYYDRGYYDRSYYAPAYYDRGYYNDYRECWTERRYDNYGYPVRVRVCN